MANFKGEGRISFSGSQKGDFTSISKFIKEATIANLWIWKNNKWFTPDEFAGQFSSETTKHEADKMLEDAKIRDPRAGINAGFKQLDELLTKNAQETEALRNKLLEFNKRVIEYYQSKSDGKKLIG